MSTMNIESSIVRIRKHDKRVVGAGFLVTEKHVLTCVHVVADALGIPWETSEKPTIEIHLDFPLVAPDKDLTAEVVEWYPIQSDGSGDIAYLKLLDKLPKHANPALLITEDPLWGHSFRAFGFPKEYDVGIWASGVLRAKQANGLVQIEDVKQTGHFILPGFSGTAIWDEEVNGVVGMTIAADRQAEARIAFVIPISCILGLLPELAQKTIPPCPYRGLFAFREQDAKFFFGRKTYTEKLVEAVQKKPLIAVIGASGSGKSSVVYAGLLPSLQRHGNWLIASFRPGKRPFYNLSVAIIPFLEPDKSEVDRIEEINKLTDKLEAGTVCLTNVSEAISRKYPGSRFLLFADQFEELYTLCREEGERHRFLDELLQACEISKTSQVSLVLTMRADFLGKALSYRPFTDALHNADLKLGPMNNDELRETIENPTKTLNVKIETGLTDRILKSVADKPGSLPLLQFALTELWKKQDNGMLTHATYDKIGGVEKALTRHADSEYVKLTPEEQTRTRRIFTQLVHPGEGTEDTRRVATHADVGENNWELVMKLADARLVVTSGSEEKSANRDLQKSGQDACTPGETVEVVHEALIRGWDRLREWMDADREFRIWQDRLRATIPKSDAGKYEESVLLRGTPLTNAEEWLNKRQSDLTDHEEQFIKVSLQAQRTSQRRRKLVIAAILVMAVVVTVVFGVLWKTADTQRQKAEIKTVEALNETSKTLFLSCNELGGLLAGVKAGQNLKEMNNLPTTLKYQTILNLRKLVYAVHEKNRLEKQERRIVLSVDFSPDGTMLASGGDGGTLTIWKVADGREITMSEGHGGAVHCITFSPDGTKLASGGWDKTIKLWNVADGKEITTLKGHSDSIFSVNFSQDGALLVSGSNDSTIKLWNVTDGKEIMTLPGDSPVRSVNFSPDDKILASGNQDRTITFWNVEEGRKLKELQEHQGSVETVNFSPDGNMLVSGSSDGTIKLWNVTDGSEIATLPGHSGPINSVNFSPDGKLLVSGSTDHTIKVWGVEERKEITTLRGHSGSINNVKFSPDSTLLASGSEDTTIRLWNLAADSSILKGHSGNVYSVSFSPDNTMLASGSLDTTITLWNVNDGRAITTLPGHAEGVTIVNFSSDGKLLASGSADWTIKLWDTEKTNNVRETRTLPGQGSVLNVNFSSDSRTLVSGSADGTIQLWDVENGEVNSTFPLQGHSGVIRSVNFSPDGELLASGANEIKLWSLPDGKEQPKLPGEKGSLGTIQSLAFGPDGKLLASGANMITLWDVGDGNEITALPGNFGIVRSVSFNPAGTLLASGSDTGAITLWDVADRREISTLEGHDDRIQSVTFSSDGTKLASGSADRTIRLWNLDLDDLLRRGCEWLDGYLNTNPYVSEEDRHGCDDIPDR